MRFFPGSVFSVLIPPFGFAERAAKYPFSSLAGLCNGVLTVLAKAHDTIRLFLHIGSMKEHFDGAGGHAYCGSNIGIALTLATEGPYHLFLRFRQSDLSILRNGLFSILFLGVWRIMG